MAALGVLLGIVRRWAELPLPSCDGAAAQRQFGMRGVDGNRGVRSYLMLSYRPQWHVVDCQIKDASELQKALRILLHAGVTDTSDMCLLQVKDLQGNLNGRPLPHLLLASHYESESESVSDSGTALLPVTTAKLVRCICTKLCDSADAPFCRKRVDTQRRQRDCRWALRLRSALSAYLTCDR